MTSPRCSPKATEACAISNQSQIIRTNICPSGGHFPGTKRNDHTPKPPDLQRTNTTSQSVLADPACASSFDGGRSGDFPPRVHHKRPAASSAPHCMPDLLQVIPSIQSRRIAAGPNWWTTLSNEQDLKLT